jgi:uncharacterized HAD superfamily protein/hypoxanthine-guanine phosphoribosyltransferase
MNFRTISDLNNLINKNLHKLPKEIDLVVGVPRSGMLVANLISLYLNVPLVDFDTMLEEKFLSCGTTKIRKDWPQNYNNIRKILIVEDSSSSGKSLKRLKEKLENFIYKDKVIILTIYVTEETRKMSDIYFEKIDGARMFEWNYLHHASVKNACFDIDGVLCRDPKEEENDDGERYKKFLLEVEPRIIPTFKIGTLVTARLEKYRAETEEWLRRNNIKYENLIMLNLKNKEERLKAGTHGKFKGEIYKKIEKACIFIESDSKQAVEIANISKKMVFCVENQQYYDDGIMKKLQEKGKVKSIIILKKILPSKIKKYIKNILNYIKEL